MNSPRNYSQAELGSLLSDLLSGRMHLYCADHDYVSGTTPPRPGCNCVKCYLAYYTYLVASRPRARQQEFLEQLESTVYPMLELIEKGKFDWKPELEVEIHKDVEDNWLPPDAEPLKN